MFQRIYLSIHRLFVNPRKQLDIWIQKNCIQIIKNVSTVTLILSHYHYWSSINMNTLWSTVLLLLYQVVHHTALWTELKWPMSLTTIKCELIVSVIVSYVKTVTQCHMWCEIQLKWYSNNLWRCIDYLLCQHFYRVTTDRIKHVLIPHLVFGLSQSVTLNSNTVWLLIGLTPRGWTWVRLNI
jgi:hypothetical protein